MQKEGPSAGHAHWGRAMEISASRWAARRGGRQTGAPRWLQRQARVPPPHPPSPAPPGPRGPLALELAPSATSVWTRLLRRRPREPRTKAWHRHALRLLPLWRNNKSREPNKPNRRWQFAAARNEQGARQWTLSVSKARDHSGEIITDGRGELASEEVADIQLKHDRSQMASKLGWMRDEPQSPSQSPPQSPLQSLLFPRQRPAAQPSASLTTEPRSRSC